MDLNSFIFRVFSLASLVPDNSYRLLLFPNVLMIPLSKTGLILVHPETNFETGIQMQVVYLGGEGNMDRKVGKRGREVVVVVLC